MVKMLNRRVDLKPEKKSLSHKIYVPRKIIGIKGDIMAFALNDKLDCFQRLKRGKMSSKTYFHLKNHQKEKSFKV